MVYFLPVGGLANRMRSIDSTINWCKRFRNDLKILWVMNHELNCSFYDLFLPINDEEIAIEVVDCPLGFPRNFLFGARNSLNSKENFFSRKVKNVLSGRHLNFHQNTILKELKRIPNSNILENNTLALIYDNLNSDLKGSSKEMDNLFAVKVQDQMTAFFSKKEIKFFESCYRIAEVNGAYPFFKLQKSIKEKLDLLKIKKNQTIGLHIRRSDHVVSKQFSSNEKFVNIVRKELEADSNHYFFICSDDHEAKMELKNIFGDRIIFNVIEDFNRNSKAAILDAVIDMYSLTKTKKIYGSHQSSFSQVASEIAGIPIITVK